jgi:hypothetical protein
VVQDARGGEAVVEARALVVRARREEARGRAVGRQHAVPRRVLLVLLALADGRPADAVRDGALLPVPVADDVGLQVVAEGRGPPAVVVQREVLAGGGRGAGEGERAEERGRGGARERQGEVVGEDEEGDGEDEQGELAPRGRRGPGRARAVHGGERVSRVAGARGTVLDVILVVVKGRLGNDNV